MKTKRIKFIGDRKWQKSHGQPAPCGQYFSFSTQCDCEGKTITNKELMGETIVTLKYKETIGVEAKKADELLNDFPFLMEVKPRPRKPKTDQG